MILILQHARNEGPGTLGDFFKRHRQRLTIVKLYRRAARVPENIEGVKAIIVMGGPMNVYEEKKFTFLKAEDTLLKKVLARRLPVLGICLGAQLLAKALGAKVHKAKQPEVGWQKITLTALGKNDPLFARIRTKAPTVFQWHQDTFEIPAGALLLAHSKTCRNQAFRYGDNCYGLQFHIEVDNMLIKAWTDEIQKKSIAAEKKLAREMRAAYYPKRKSYSAQAQKIYRNFSELIRTAPQ